MSNLFPFTWKIDQSTQICTHLKEPTILHNDEWWTMNHEWCIMSDDNIWWWSSSSTFLIIHRTTSIIIHLFSAPFISLFFFWKTHQFHPLKTVTCSIAWRHKTRYSLDLRQLGGALSLSVDSNRIFSLLRKPPDWNHSKFEQLEGKQTKSVSNLRSSYPFRWLWNFMSFLFLT